jgi:hypothetical protein
MSMESLPAALRDASAARRADIAMKIDQATQTSAGIECPVVDESALRATESELKKYDRVVIAATELIRDWRKGDFELPRLAECDAEVLEDALLKLAKD